MGLANPHRKNDIRLAFWLAPAAVRFPDSARASNRRDGRCEPILHRLPCPSDKKRPWLHYIIPVVAYSVVLVCRNHSEFIESAIRSLLAQTLPPAKLLVIDVASSDDSREKVVGYADRYPGRIEVRLLAHRNMVEVLQQTIGEIATPYVSFLSADDYFCRGRFGQQVAALESASLSVVLCFTDVQTVGEFDKWNPRIPLAPVSGIPQVIPAAAARRSLVEKNWIVAPSVLLRTDIARPAIISLDPSMPFEDYPLWLRLSREFDFLYLPSRLTYYRQHAESASGNSRNRRKFIAPQVLLLCRELERNPDLARVIFLRTFSLLKMALRNLEAKATLHAVSVMFRAGLQTLTIRE